LQYFVNKHSTICTGIATNSVTLLCLHVSKDDNNDEDTDILTETETNRRIKTSAYPNCMYDMRIEWQDSKNRQNEEKQEHHTRHDNALLPFEIDNNHNYHLVQAQ